LDAGAYTRFAIGITLATTNGSVTPEIDEIITYYRSTETPRTNMAINMRGNKVIGTIASVPVYKYNASFTTSASTGEVIIADLEFDSYTITTPDSVDIVSACPGTPVLHQAGVDSMVEFVYTSDRADSARVTVINGFGQPIPGATVSMTRPGYSDSIETDTCGQAFFGSGVTAEADYVITVSKPGYTAETVNPFNISGDATSLVIMTPL